VSTRPSLPPTPPALPAHHHLLPPCPPANPPPLPGTGSRAGSLQASIHHAPFPAGLAPPRAPGGDQSQLASSPTSDTADLPAPAHAPAPPPRPSRAPTPIRRPRLSRGGPPLPPSPWRPPTTAQRPDPPALDAPSPTTKHTRWHPGYPRTPHTRARAPGHRLPFTGLPPADELRSDVVSVPPSFPPPHITPFCRTATPRTVQSPNAPPPAWFPAVRVAVRPLDRHTDSHRHNGPCPPPPRPYRPSPTPIPDTNTTTRLRNHWRGSHPQPIAAASRSPPPPPDHSPPPPPTTTARLPPRAEHGLESALHPATCLSPPQTLRPTPHRHTGSGNHRRSPAMTHSLPMHPRSPVPPPPLHPSTAPAPPPPPTPPPPPPPHHPPPPPTPRPAAALARHPAAGPVA